MMYFISLLFIAVSQLTEPVSAATGTMDGSGWPRLQTYLYSKDNTSTAIVTKPCWGAWFFCCASRKYYNPEQAKVDACKAFTEAVGKSKEDPLSKLTACKPAVSDAAGGKKGYFYYGVKGGGSCSTDSTNSALDFDLQLAVDGKNYDIVTSDDGTGPILLKSANLGAKAVTNSESLAVVLYYAADGNGEPYSCWGQKQWGFGCCGCTGCCASAIKKDKTVDLKTSSIWKEVHSDCNISGQVALSNTTADSTMKIDPSTSATESNAGSVTKCYAACDGIITAGTGSPSISPELGVFVLSVLGVVTVLRRFRL